MAITIKNNIIEEDIIDENGKKLGVIKINPQDERIMAKMGKILEDLSDAIEENNKLKTIKLDDKELQTAEDFAKAKNDINAIVEKLENQSAYIDKVFKGLEEIFGKNIVDLFTGGAQDLDAIMPLIDFLTETRKNLVGKKIEKYSVSSTDVLE